MTEVQTYVFAVIVETLAHEHVQRLSWWANQEHIPLIALEELALVEALAVNKGVGFWVDPKAEHVHLTEPNVIRAVHTALDMAYQKNGMKRVIYKLELVIKDEE